MNNNLPGYQLNGALDQLASLLNCLRDEGLRFCSWKSNLHLAAGLSGATDLDLLIAPEDLGRFTAILEEQGCVAVSPPADGDHPGMSHYLGLDPETGVLFHLHLHDRLVLGQRFTKNYVIPLTDLFLDMTESRSGMPIVDPALELIILVTRTLLKYRLRDLIKDVLGIRTPGIREETMAEIAWCIDSSSEEELAASLEKCHDSIPPQIIQEFLSIVQHTPQAGRKIWALRLRLDAALKPFRRRNLLLATLIYFRALWERRLRPHFDSRLRTAGTGPTIAFVGADGSGKTSMSAEIATWLGAKLAVSRYYMGSKQPSKSTNWSYLGFRAFRRAHRDLSRRTRKNGMITTALASVRDVWLAAHHLAVASDRLARLRKSRSDNNLGRVVLLDRYPLDTIGQTRRERLLDGPSIEPGTSQTLKRLADLEVRLYQKFEPPDGLVFLTVDPQVAVARKPDHDPAVIADKAMAASNLLAKARASHLQNRVFEIDANQAWDPTLHVAKQIVWQILSKVRPN